MDKMVSVQIQLTTVCNERCVFCEKYNWPKNVMGPIVLTNILRKYKDAGNLQFSGGEPLMYPHLNYLNSLLACGTRPYKVYSNLALPVFPGTEQYEFLMRAKEISTSLDGMCKEDYNAVRRPVSPDTAFQHLIDNIFQFKDKVKACMVVTNQNYKSVLNMYEWCEEHGVKSRFYGVHTHEEFALNAEQKEELAEMIFEHLKDIGTDQSNLFQFLTDLTSEEQEGFVPCHVRNHHRVVDESGKEYTCCYAINDNGSYEGQKHSLDDNYHLSPDLEYTYCERCTRYKHANKNWKELSNTNIFL